MTGIDSRTALVACCGNGGVASASSTTEGCGSSGAPVCSHPDRYISWDGIHLTQKAYSVLSKWLVADIIPKLNCALQVVDHSDKAIIPLRSLFPNAG